jgi:hypothetical protein
MSATASTDSAITASHAMLPNPSIRIVFIEASSPYNRFDARFISALHLQAKDE